MCVAIHLPPRTTLTDDEIAQCWNQNSDGAGFMYPYDGKLKVIKGFMALKGFIKAFRWHEEQYNAVKRTGKGQGGFAVHFRIKTHGKRDVANCHPHVIYKNVLGLVHNGVISGYPWKDTQELSDTALFVKEYLSKFPANWWHNQAVCNMIAGFITSSNKFITMDNEGRVMIYNPSAGTTDKQGRWFSNMYWEQSLWQAQCGVQSRVPYHYDTPVHQKRAVYNHSDTRYYKYQKNQDQIHGWQKCSQCKDLYRIELIEDDICEKCISENILAMRKGVVDTTPKPIPPPEAPFLID